jgi:replicative DNA helicase
MEYTNQEAEEVLLGSIIMNNNFLLPLDFLAKEHFAFTEHQAIFGEIIRRITNNDSVDSVTIQSFADKNTIKKLLASASGILDIKSYGIEIVGLWQKRELNQALEYAKNEFLGDFRAIKEYLDGIMADLSFALSKEPRNAFEIAKEVIENEYQKKELINLGFENSDNLIGGIAVGSLFILAGRSSSGKTTMCLNIAKNLSKEAGVLFFSIEVNEKSLVRKLVTEEVSIDPYRLKKGFLNASEKQAGMRAVEIIKQSQLIVDDDSELTLSKIRNRIKRIMIKQPLKAICIDYLQLITPEGKDFSREQQVSKIVVGLKSIARDFNIVVFALSQLSRATDSRDNKRPILSDLRDSGAIEQAADIVAFVHRDEYYLEREREPEHSPHYKEWLGLYEASKGVANFIIAKNRDGQIGDVKFYFDGKFSRFIEN